MAERIVVAVDGPAASGKGTLARRLAAQFGFAYLDTGALYRAVGLAVLHRHGEEAGPDDMLEVARSLTAADVLVLTGHPSLRTDRTAVAASRVAAVAAVRDTLADIQRRFAVDPPEGARGAVLDGRDIGTVICPGADAKLFVIADTEVRAHRRLKELHERGVPAIWTEVLQDLKDRDDRDSRRSVAPLRPAHDAFLIDTSELSPTQVFDKAIAFLHSRPAFAALQPSV